MSLQKGSIRRWIGEWLTIFVSIMAAFSLDRCNDARLESRQLDLYMHAMVKDLQKDSLELEKNIMECHRNLRALDRAATFSKQPGKVPDSVLTYSLNAFATVSQFLPQETTYQAMMGAGGLAIVQDFELRSAIVELYHHYEQVQLVDKVQLDFAQNQVLPYLSHNFDLSVPKPLTPELLSQSGFRNLVLLAISGVSEQRKTYRATLEKCVTLKRRIETSFN